MGIIRQYPAVATFQTLSLRFLLYVPLPKPVYPFHLLTAFIKALPAPNIEEIFSFCMPFSLQSYKVLSLFLLELFIFVVFPTETCLGPGSSIPVPLPALPIEYVISWGLACSISIPALLRFVQLLEVVSLNSILFPSELALREKLVRLFSVKQNNSIFQHPMFKVPKPIYFILPICLA